MEVVKTLKEGGFLALATAPILEECYNTLKEFLMAMIEHCDREANQVAHKPARQTFISKDFCMDSRPSFIFHALANVM